MAINHPVGKHFQEARCLSKPAPEVQGLP